MDTTQRRLCFERETLSDPDVSIAEFISTVRTKAPLSTLREDLRFHLDEISNELIAQIQANFTDFISLGRAVADVDHLVDATASPLKSLQGDVSTVLESFDSDVVKLEKTLDKRRQLATRRTVLELYLRISDLVHKCERLLKEVDGCASNSDERYRILERTASESAQLAFCLSRADKNSKFVVALQPRLEKLKAGVRSKLEAWLKSALQTDQEVLTRALAAFAAAEMVSDAEKLFRAEVVAPFVASRLKMSACVSAAEQRKGLNSATSTLSRREGREDTASSTDGNAMSITAADALASAEEFIRAFVKERCEPVTTLCDAEERLREFDFVNNAVWPESIADVFHKSFRGASRIFGIMASACTTPARLERLHSHPATQAFWRKWSLPVYFQLRFQEITGTFEASLETAPKQPELKAVESTTDGDETGSMYSLLSPDAYQLGSTQMLVKSLRLCWDDDVFLQPLTHRFLRLSLQLLSRYVRWVQHGLGSGWDNDVGSKELAVVYSDVEILGERLGAELASMVRMEVTNGLGASDLSAIDSAFADAVSNLISVLPAVAEKISGLITKNCIDSLQPLRGILATYRMTNRPAPTQPSRFVPNVLKPLRQFLADPRLKISGEARKSITALVIESTVNRYFEMATDLLSNVRRAADTLKRLNIGRQDRTTSAVGSNAEMDKITMQLYLDVRKFGADIQSLGVSTDAIPAYQRLWECVSVDTPTEPPTILTPQST